MSFKAWPGPARITTIFSGRTTSGKLTLAFKTLAGAQQRAGGEQVAILDLTRQSDPDYLARCGVDLDRLLIARPSPGPGVVDLLVDLLGKLPSRCKDKCIQPLMSCT